MNSLYTSLSKKKVNCIVCNSDDSEHLGIRGNREYSGANQKATPHVFTNVVKCKICDFIYTNPLIIGADHLEKLHYSDPKVYETTQQIDPIEMFSKRIAIIKKYKTQGSLLDIGAGKGEFLLAAKKSGYTIFGIEPSKGLSEYANNQNNLNITHGFLEDLQIPKIKYDIITMNHVFEHVENPHELLTLIKSFMKKDALLFIEVPNTGSLFLKMIDFYYRIKGLSWSGRLSPLHPPFHKFGYNKTSLAYILIKHNFTINSTKTVTGKDRGFEEKDDIDKYALMLRKIATFVVNLLGNRELLIITAKLK